MSNYELITRNMVGRFLMIPPRVDLLEKYLKRSRGWHLDIGTFHGGSAILALLNGRKVTTVDPFDGFYGKVYSDDPRYAPVDETTLSSNVIEVMRAANLHDWTPPEIVASTSQDWQPTRMYDTAFLDGEHAAPECFMDWFKAREIVRDFIIIDDVDENYPDQFEVMLMAIRDPQWELVEYVLDENGRGTCAFQRRE